MGRKADSKKDKSNGLSVIIWFLTFILIGGAVYGLVALDKHMKDKDDEDKEEKIIQIESSDHVKGEEEAPMTIFEYSNYSCPACSQYYPALNDIVSQYPEKVKIVFRHFPFNTNAEEAAWASEAAAEQEKFWEMSEILFSRQDEWKSKSPEDLIEIFKIYGEEINLDIDAFSTAYESEDVRDKVMDSLNEAIDDLGLTHTPTIFLDGKELEGTMEEIQEKIIEEIEAES